MRLFIGLIALLQILLFNSPTATVQPINPAQPVSTAQPGGVPELVSAAKMIAVGTITSASADGLRGLMKVTEYFKSGVPQASLQLVPNCPTANTCSEARYQTQQQVVLFLQQTDEGWTTVQGATGMYTVRDSRVFNAANSDVGSLDEVKAQLVQLTGQQGAAAPDDDPTPEAQTAPVANDDSIPPALYIAVIAAGVIGMVAMAVLARRVK